MFVGRTEILNRLDGLWQKATPSLFRSLLPVLGIDGASLLSAAPYRRAREAATCGVQVDLLIQTKTTAYVVEIKRLS